MTTSTVLSLPVVGQWVCLMFRYERHDGHPPAVMMLANYVGDQPCVDDKKVHFHSRWGVSGWHGAWTAAGPSFTASTSPASMQIDFNFRGDGHPRRTTSVIHAGGGTYHGSDYKARIITMFLLAQFPMYQGPV